MALGAGLWRGAGPRPGRSLRALPRPAPAAEPPWGPAPSGPRAVAVTVPRGPRARLQFLDRLLRVGEGGGTRLRVAGGVGTRRGGPGQPLRSGPLPLPVLPRAAAKTRRDPDLAEVPRERAHLPSPPLTVCPTRSLKGEEGV